MPENRGQQVVLSGNVIELFNCDDVLCAKVLMKPDYLEINIDTLGEFHLGDQIDIFADLKISKIKPYFGRIEDGQEK
jgi:hypothetical protein